MPNISKESFNSGHGFKTTFIQIWALIVAGNQNSNFTQLPIFFARGTNLSFVNYGPIYVLEGGDIHMCIHVCLWIALLNDPFSFG